MELHIGIDFIITEQGGAEPARQDLAQEPFHIPAESAEPAAPTPVPAPSKSAASPAPAKPSAPIAKPQTPTKSPAPVKPTSSPKLEKKPSPGEFLRSLDPAARKALEAEVAKESKRTTPQPKKDETKATAPQAETPPTVAVQPPRESPKPAPALPVQDKGTVETPVAQTERKTAAKTPETPRVVEDVRPRETVAEVRDREAVEKVVDRPAQREREQKESLVVEDRPQAIEPRLPVAPKASSVEEQQEPVPTARDDHKPEKPGSAQAPAVAAAPPSKPPTPPKVAESAPEPDGDRPKQDEDEEKKPAHKKPARRAVTAKEAVEEASSVEPSPPAAKETAPAKTVQREPEVIPAVEEAPKSPAVEQPRAKAPKAVRQSKREAKAQEERKEPEQRVVQEQPSDKAARVERQKPVVMFSGTPVKEAFPSFAEGKEKEIEQKAPDELAAWRSAVEHHKTLPTVEEKLKHRKHLEAAHTSLKRAVQEQKPKEPVRPVEPRLPPAAAAASEASPSATPRQPAPPSAGQRRAAPPRVIEQPSAKASATVSEPVRKPKSTAIDTRAGKHQPAAVTEPPRKPAQDQRVEDKRSPKPILAMMGTAGPAAPAPPPLWKPEYMEMYPKDAILAARKVISQQFPGKEREMSSQAEAVGQYVYDWSLAPKNVYKRVLGNIEQRQEDVDVQKVLPAVRKATDAAQQLEPEYPLPVAMRADQPAQRHVVEEDFSLPVEESVVEQRPTAPPSGDDLVDLEDKPTAAAQEPPRKPPASPPVAMAEQPEQPEDANNRQKNKQEYKSTEPEVAKEVTPPLAQREAAATTPQAPPAPERRQPRTVQEHPRKPTEQVVQQQGAAANAKRRPKGFRTSKGSTYELHDDGTTTRNKAVIKMDGSDVVHPLHEGDSGKKERSVKTVYVDTKQAAGLSSAGQTNAAGGPVKSRVVVKDGKASLLTWNDKENRWGVAPSGRDVPFSEEPQVGMSPLELWQPREDIPGHEAYGGMHAGHAITDIEYAPESEDEERVVSEPHQNPPADTPLPPPEGERGAAKEAAPEKPAQKIADRIAEQRVARILDPLKAKEAVEPPASQQPGQRIIQEQRRETLTPRAVQQNRPPREKTAKERKLTSEIAYHRQKAQEARDAGAKASTDEERAKHQAEVERQEQNARDNEAKLERVSVMADKVHEHRIATFPHGATGETADFGEKYGVRPADSHLAEEPKTESADEQAKTVEQPAAKVEPADPIGADRPRDVTPPAAAPSADRSAPAGDVATQTRTPKRWHKTAADVLSNPYRDQQKKSQEKADEYRAKGIDSEAEWYQRQADQDAKAADEWQEKHEQIPVATMAPPRPAPKAAQQPRPASQPQSAAQEKLPVAAFADAGAAQPGKSALQGTVSEGPPPAQQQQYAERADGPWSLESTQLVVLETLRNLQQPAQQSQPGEARQQAGYESLSPELREVLERKDFDRMDPYSQRQLFEQDRARSPSQSRQVEDQPAPRTPRAPAQRPPSRGDIPEAVPLHDEDAYKKRAREGVANREREKRAREVRREVDPEFAKEEDHRENRENARLMAMGGAAIGGNVGRMMGIASQILGNRKAMETLGSFFGRSKPKETVEEQRPARETPEETVELPTAVVAPPGSGDSAPYAKEVPTAVRAPEGSGDSAPYVIPAPPETVVEHPKASAPQVVADDRARETAQQETEQQGPWALETTQQAVLEALRATSPPSDRGERGGAAKGDESDTVTEPTKPDRKRSVEQSTKPVEQEETEDEDAKRPPSMRPPQGPKGAGKVTQPRPANAPSQATQQVGQKAAGAATRAAGSAATSAGATATGAGASGAAGAAGGALAAAGAAIPIAGAAIAGAHVATEAIAGVFDKQTKKMDLSLQQRRNASEGGAYQVSRGMNIRAQQSASQFEDIPIVGDMIGKVVSAPQRMMAKAVEHVEETFVELGKGVRETSRVFTEVASFDSKGFASHMGEVAEQRIPFFGTVIRSATDGMLQFAHGLKQGRDRLAEYDGRLANQQAAHEVREINRDMQRASRFGEGVERANDARFGAEQKLSDIADRLMPLVLAIGEKLFQGVESGLGIADNGLKAVLKGMDVMIELLQKAVDWLLTNDQKAMIASIRDLLRRMMEDNEGDSDTLWRRFTRM